MSCKAVVIARYSPIFPRICTIEIPIVICRGTTILVQRRGLQRHNSARHAFNIRERHFCGGRHEQIWCVGCQRGHVIRTRFTRRYYLADPYMLVLVVCHILEVVECAALISVAFIVEWQYHRCSRSRGKRAVIGHALDIAYLLRDVHAHEIVTIAVEGYAGSLIPFIEVVIHYCIAVLRCVVIAVVEEAVLVALHQSVICGRITKVGGLSCRCGSGASLPVAEGIGIVTVRHVVSQGRLTVWIDERAAVVAQCVFARAVCGGSR